MKRPMIAALACLVLVAEPATVHAQAPAGADDGEEVDEITIRARRVANLRPAGTYAAAATALRFDPLTELQSRGLPEGQADVTVRGGLFENTGFTVGAVTLLDPQTGHYAVELPIDPAMLSTPRVLTGIDSALGGFNSSIATVAYAIPALYPGGSVAAGAGSDDLEFQSLRVGVVATARSGAELGAALSAARSKGDGSLPNGDHEFERYNLQLQRVDDDSQMDLIVAYQDKFYGWPGAYTGFASLAETDHTKTNLALVAHRHALASGWLELGAFYRSLDDDYDFDRTTEESGAPGAFDHETEAYALGFAGLYEGVRVAWRYSGQLTWDRLLRSTDLTSGDFNRRRYVKLGLVPSVDIRRSGGATMNLRFGATFDDSDHDESAVSPLLGLTLRKPVGDGAREIALQYAGTSQVPGYTALNSRPTGLFGGNATLGREKARQLTASFVREMPAWRASLTVFYREDDDLVDWTFARGAPFARQANAVDVDVKGIEALYQRSWRAFDLGLGVTFLDKSADYGSATVDASYYALNYARLRTTLAARYRIGERIELRWDSEYRSQKDNPLRTSSDYAFIASLALAWEPAGGEGLGIAVTADNLTDSDYEQFPGTPAVGRQVSISVGYEWN